MFYGIDNIPQNIPHIQSRYEKYSVEYFQSNRTLLWIRMMLWSMHVS